MIVDPIFSKLQKHIDGLRKNIDNMIYKKDYGFIFDIYKNYLKNKLRLAIPYIRKDTPVENSYFSDIVLTILLTIKIYEKNNFKLNDHDYENLDSNFGLFVSFYNKLIDLKIIDTSKFNKNKLDYKKLVSNKFILFREKNLQKLFKKIYSDNDSFEKKLQILKIYLFHINEDKFSYTSKLKNMSFQDIIYNNYNQIQIGYTGTANIKLYNDELNEDDKDYVFSKIEEDIDEKIEVNLALYQYSNNKQKINSDDNLDDIKYEIIYKTDDIQKNIEYIMSKGINRGIVDMPVILLIFQIKKLQKNYII